MYSPEIESLLKSKKIKIGDVIRVTKGKEEFGGILLPRTESGSSSNVVLKLENGYNIGIRFDKGALIKKIAPGKPIRFSPAKSVPKKDPEKPTVSILGTGGTIGSRVEYKTGAVYPAFSPADLIMTIPDIKEVANIRGRKLFDAFSNDVTVEHWKLICREIEKEIKSGSNGIVLTHGTDTLAVTSSGLSFMLRNLPVPVVITAAQRSSDRGSSDGFMNMLCSVVTASKSDIGEVSVCMHATQNDDFCFVNPGVKVRKMHSSRRDAFKTINVLPFAKVLYKEKRIEYIRSDYHKKGDGKFYIDYDMNPNVLMMWEHPNLKPEIIDSLSDQIEGLVFVATGLGHTHTNYHKDPKGVSLLGAFSELIGSGIPVVFASHTINGRLNLKVYSSGREEESIGIIGSEADWTPEAAYCKLMHVLAKTKEMKKIREMMMTNMVGEISERTEVESYG